ncbi:MAG: hypothetical protein IIC21_12240 [Chloroflexi bacterium]|nr:hypothetical protein [Chloroflexota bacterium]
MHEEPEALPDAVPQELQRVVLKCLQKEAGSRYQTAENLVTDLRKLRQNSDLNRPAVETARGIFRKTRDGKRSTLLATAVVLMLAMASYFGYQFFSDKPVDSEKSIVVLPFADLSPDRDNAYFSDGLTEEITTDLSHVCSLHVISRSSAMMFKGSKKSLSEIGKELNVQYALMGSVMKVDNDVRISVQLLDTGNDSHLWANKYRGTLDDIFDIQEQVFFWVGVVLVVVAGYAFWRYHRDQARVVMGRLRRGSG